MTTATDAAETTPDWSALPADVRCPLCDYNLRGLTDPRCPECGYAFAWADVLAPPPTHPWLFECQPRRNVWSFARTQAGGYRPRRFWSTLRPEVRIRPVRLVAYWALSVALLVAGVAVGLGRSATDVKADNRRYAARTAAYFAANPLPPGQTLAAVLATCDPPVWSARFWRLAYWRADHSQPLTAWAAFVCWPWATFAALQVFAVSMRRAKVRRGHVLRCVLYSCDFGLVAGVFLFVVVGSAGYRPLVTPFVLSVAAVAAYVAHRLGAAYQLYLRFSHPYLTAIASQVIVFLVACKAALWSMGY